MAPYAKQENTNEKTNNSDILIKRNNNADPSCRMDNFDPIIQKVRSDVNFFSIQIIKTRKLIHYFIAL